MEQLAKIMYVWLIRFFSLLSKPLRVKKRIIYLMSFPKNNNGLLEDLVNEFSDSEIWILFEESCKKEVNLIKNERIHFLPISTTFSFLKKAIPLLMGAKVILCDNYFPFLAGLYPRKETKIIQFWHANGAIKRFGLEDPTAMKRSNFDQRRFKQVYKRFDEYVVGSEMMGKVFQRSYGAKSNNIKLLGNPRTDIYFNKEAILEKQKRFFQEFPKLKGRKIILYAPTYRNDMEKEYPLDVRRLYGVLGDEYAILMKKHPHILERPIQNEYKDFFYGNLNHYKIEDLLVVSDILITDYSSVPFDFTLLDNAKKIIFYCYDLEEYNQTTGVQHDFKKWIPGEIAYSMDDVIEQLQKDNQYDFSDFNYNWNSHNDGCAKKRLIAYIKSLNE